MSPILVRPVREQLEHDRIIRLLQAKNRRKYDGPLADGSAGDSAQFDGRRVEPHRPDQVLAGRQAIDAIDAPIVSASSTDKATSN